MDPETDAVETPRDGGDSAAARALARAEVALDSTSYREAALRTTSELATALGCERVSLGFEHRGRMRVEVLSHGTRFDRRSALARDLAEAMHEACDQDAVLAIPAAPEAPVRVTRAHERLAGSHGASAVCTVPLALRGRTVGALTLERTNAVSFPPAVIAEIVTAARVLGPALALGRQIDRRPLDRLRSALDARLASLLSPGRAGPRLAAAAAVVSLVLMAGVPGTHRVRAEATLEGVIQRAIVAGIDGYVAEAGARAGDRVEAGQVLARLDDRDLALERRRWEAKTSQLRHEYRNAVALHDRSERRVVQARLDEARAQLALLDEQIARTHLVAPFDGIVVRGDLSQSLGAPVEKGDVLYEVAPADGYRIILEVDERDVSWVERGSRGVLALTALPGEPLSLEVERITPVSTAERGRNFFRVEARLASPHRALRPGMAGVARIDAGRRRLLWIWTHELVDWLRFAAWSWRP